MKTQKTNTKKYIIIFLIAFAIPIVYQLTKHFSLFKPSILKPYTSTKEMRLDNISAQTGCYEIGIWSDDKVLNNHITDGEFEISYYRDNQLLKKSTASKDAQVAYSMRTGNISFIVFDTFSMPFEGKYPSISISFKTVKKDSLLEKQKELFLYVKKSVYDCKLDRTKLRNKKKYPITKDETNTTLKPLYEALKTKDTQKVKKLIESGIDPDVKMIGKRTPLHYTAFYNDTKTMKYLIDKKVDLNVKDIIGKTPLHYGIERNATKAVKLLLESGADLSLVEKVEDTYLNRCSGADIFYLSRYVTEANLYKLTEILLEAGMNPNKTPYTHTPYEYLLQRMLNYNYRKSRGEQDKYDYDYSKMITLIKLYGAKTYEELQQEKNTTKGNK